MFDAGLLNDVLYAFDQAASRWAGNLYPYALRLFALLAALEITWSAVREILDPEGHLGRFLALLLRKLLYLGFAFWLLTLAPVLLPRIIDGFQRAGNLASGTTGLSPSAFLGTGADAVTTIASKLNLLGFLTDPFGSFLAVASILLILLAYTAMAATLLLALVESYFLIGAGSFLLAFAASRWTAPLAEGAILAVVRLALRLFMLYLLSGLILELARQWADRLATATFIGPFDLFVFVGVSVILAILFFALPRLAAQVLPVTSHFGLTPKVADN